MTTDPAVITPEHEMLNWGRLLLDGLPYADIVAARDRPEGVSWFAFWTGRAEQYERLAEEALDRGHTLTAGEFFYLGALATQYGQFLWFDEQRAAGQRRKVELYRRAAPLLDPPAQRVELEVDGLVMPVYVRLPRGDGPHPIVIMLGGLESTKEESLHMENLVLARGMGTATFDGPGQGEMFAHRRLSGDFERYTSAVVDHLVERTDVAPARIGLLGRSLGGNYALKSAACDNRIAACVCWGGFSDMDEWDAETPLTKESWRYVSKVATLEEARDHVREAVDTRDVLGDLRCPTYVVHGALDEVPMTFVDTLRAHAVNAAELTIVVEAEGDHCCHNLGPAPRLHMADWLHGHLVRASKENR